MFNLVLWVNRYIFYTGFKNLRVKLCISRFSVLWFFLSSLYFVSLLEAETGPPPSVSLFQPNSPFR